VKIQNLVMSVFCAIVLMSVAPAASAKVTCGGLKANGKLMASCGSKPAILVGKVSRSCPSGSVFNLKTWACWTKCPADYKRTTQRVDGGKACKRTKEFLYTRSTDHGSGSCPSGTAYDVYQNRASCFTCPTGKILVPTKGCASPSRALTGPYSAPRATRNPCSDGLLVNLSGKNRCISCPKGYSINGANPSSSNPKTCRKALPTHVSLEKVSSIGCPKKEDQFFNLVDGGTCWKCPAFYTRSALTKIKGPKACVNRTIGWETPKFKEPGLFGLAGADLVAIDILTNQRELLHELILNRKEQTRKLLGLKAPADFVKTQWRLIHDDPANSPDLLFAMFARLIAVATSNDKKSAGEANLIKSFSAYIRDRRTHMAEDGLNMYYAWKQAEDYKIAHKMTMNSAGLMSLADSGAVPLDFAKIASQGLEKQGMSSAAAAGITAGGVGVAGGALSTAAAYFQAVRMAKTFETLRGTTLGTIKALKAGATALKSAKGLLQVSGPLVIVSVAAEILEAGIKKLHKITTAERDLKTGLANAKKSVSLSKMVKSGQMKTLTLYWGAAVNGDRTAPKSVLSAAQTAYALQGYKDGNIRQQGRIEMPK